MLGFAFEEAMMLEVATFLCRNEVLLVGSSPFVDRMTDLRAFTVGGKKTTHTHTHTGVPSKLHCIAGGFQSLTC